MNIFERASRKQLRFNSSKGNISTDDLWNLSLQALDKMAVATNEQLQKTATVSFIGDDKNSKATVDLQLQLDLLKHVITSKISDKDAAKKRAESMTEKSFLQDLLNKKRLKGMENLTEEELSLRIAKLEG